jgi:hypothetical protein
VSVLLPEPSDRASPLALLPKPEEPKQRGVLRNFSMTPRRFRNRISGVSLAQILEEPPAFSVAERQLLIRRAIEIDEPLLSPDDEALISSRLEAHRRDPSSAVSFDEMKRSLRSRFMK